MRKTLLLLFLGIFSTAIFANDYKLNDAVVDELFNNATEIAFDFARTENIDFVSLNSITQLNSEKDAIIAWLLTYTASIGICGVHRLYLGTEIITFI